MKSKKIKAFLSMYLEFMDKCLLNVQSCISSKARKWNTVQHRSTEGTKEQSFKFCSFSSSTRSSICHCHIKIYFEKKYEAISLSELDLSLNVNACVYNTNKHLTFQPDDILPLPHTPQG